MIIKYKGYRPSVNVIVNITRMVWETSDNQEKLFVNWWYNRDGSLIMSGDYVGDSLVLLPSMGIKDEAGTEVIDGSVLYYDQQDDPYAIVRWSEENKAFMLDVGYDLLYKSDWGVGKVVDNIHTNPNWRKMYYEVDL